MWKCQVVERDIIKDLKMDLNMTHLALIMIYTSAQVQLAV